jgi:hypothetical protein
MLKKCRICGIDKPLKDFYHDKSMKGGHQTIGQECRKTRDREHRDSVLENGHTRTLEQREHMSAGHRGREPWNKGTGGCKKGHDPDLYVRMPSGVYVCLACKRENGAKYRAKNRERIRIKTRVGRYDITIDELDELWSKQSGCCAICGEALDTEKYRIDHDHTSGKVRGILCHSCNTGIGLLQDSPKILFNAMEYLKNARKKD